MSRFINMPKYLYDKANIFYQNVSELFHRTRWMFVQRSYLSDEMSKKKRKTILIVRWIDMRMCLCVSLPVHPIHGFKYYELLATNRKKLCKSESFRYVTTNWLRICIVCGLVSLNCPMSHRRTLNSDYENLARTSPPPIQFNNQHTSASNSRADCTIDLFNRYSIDVCAMCNTHSYFFFFFIRSFIYVFRTSIESQTIIK